MSQRDLLSIVTVMWNGAADAPRFLDAIERARPALPFDLEVISVDNASSDGCADVVARHPSVRLIRNAANEGFARGCNQGLEAARGDYLLLLNPDCEADAAALGRMVGFLRDHPQAGAVGCALLHGDGLPQNSWHRELSALTYWGTHSLFSGPLLRLRKLAYRAGLVRRSQPLSVDWLMGACLMTRRDVYESVGGLDESFFMYSEDTDWCRRMRDAGWQVVHLPDVSIVHHHGVSAARQPEFAFRRLYRSLLMYANKRLDAPRAAALRAAVLLDMVVRLPFYWLGGGRGRLESARRVLAMYWLNDPGLHPDDAPR